MLHLLAVSPQDGWNMIFKKHPTSTIGHLCSLLCRRAVTSTSIWNLGNCGHSPQDDSRRTSRSAQGPASHEVPSLGAPHGPTCRDVVVGLNPLSPSTPTITLQPAWLFSWLWRPMPSSDVTQLTLRYLDWQSHPTNRWYTSSPAHGGSIAMSCPQTLSCWQPL